MKFCRENFYLKILEDKSYDLLVIISMFIVKVVQKLITLHRFSDGTRLKEHIITPTHIENSQKITQEIESKKNAHHLFDIIF